MKTFSKFVSLLATISIVINIVLLIALVIVLAIPPEALPSWLTLPSWLEGYVMYSFIITPCVCLGLIFISLCQAYLNKEVRKQSLKNSLLLLVSGIIPILIILYLLVKANQSGFRG